MNTKWQKLRDPIAMRKSAAFRLHQLAGKIEAPVYRGWDLNDHQYEAMEQAILRNKFIPIPPASRNQSSYGDDFLQQGVNMMRRLRMSVGLTPQSSVLDLGCGIGRLALPLTQYLTKKGSYFGIDINLDAISWCHENIHQTFRNFRFAVINAANRDYRNRYEYGQRQLGRESLPVPTNERFDVVVAYSVFTHLRQQDVEFYLRTLPTMMKPRAKLMCSWFLINDQKRRALDAGTSRLVFDLNTDGPTYLLKDQAYSAAIATEESFVLDFASQNGLRLVSREYAPWEKGVLGQDTLIFERTAT